MKNFEISRDSLLNDGTAYFGKRGRLMHIVKVLEMKPRKNSVRDVQFKIFLARPVFKKGVQKNEERLSVLHFALGEVEIEQSRKSIVYRFYNGRGARKTFTVILGLDEMATTF